MLIDGSSIGLGTLLEVAPGSRETERHALSLDNYGCRHAIGLSESALASNSSRERLLLGSDRRVNESRYPHHH